MDDRRAKLERLREQGIDPFPHEFEGVVPTSSVVDDLEPGQETDRAYRVAGRMVARRDQGGAAFIDLVDREGKIQLHAKRDVLGEESFDRLVSLDIGDLIGVDGTAFKTRRGQLSLLVTDWKLLAKSLRDVPKEYYGVEDVETRYRHREIDLLANAESRELFILRSKIVRAIRRWLDERGFLEVETPILQPLYGGALARPFVTHHNELDRDFFLRIADELYLKRLIVGGLERVYEIGKDFRNEGVSLQAQPRVHDARVVRGVRGLQRHREPAGGADLVRGRRGGLRRPDRLLTALEAQDARGTRSGTRRASTSTPATSCPARARGPSAWTRCLSHHVEPDLQNPTLILDYPKELSPFAKDHRSEEGLVERFEAFAGGMEFANAFTELNDPDEQRARFEQQRADQAAGDEETQPYDEDYIEALEHGMPPTGGIGIGIDRLTMILSGRDSIREVVLFPAMRS